MQGEIRGLAREALLDRLFAAPGELAVATPNRRLSQALVAEVDARHLAAGHPSWAAPDVLPLEALLARAWDEVLHSEAGAGLPIVLSELQEQALWEESIAGSRHGAVLFSPGAAAAQCRRAWKLAHEWGLEGRLAAAAAGEDARAFVDWSQRYLRLSRERGTTDAARLPGALFALPGLERARLPRRLFLYGFDQLTPQQQATVAALQALGCEVGRVEPPARTSVAHRRAFTTPDEEFGEIACWARARLESNPSARVGIVVPELARERQRVRRALARVLQPGYQLEVADAPAPYEISLGAALADAPVVADALAVLRLCGREVAMEDASTVLRSPFLAHAESEAAARARLDAELRKRLGLEATLEALVRLASADSMPRAGRLTAMLSRLVAHRDAALARRQGAGDWARGFARALHLAGFPGERGSDSHEYQAWEKFHEALASFAALERVVPAMRHEEACARLERYAREVVFQPRGHGAPVHVLGVIEAAGLDFDHLWVCGLTDEAWPRPPRPHPMLPVMLQREAGIPQADAAGALALDRRITQAWLAAAAEVVLSHARMQGDSEAGVSPLVREVPEITREALGLPAYPSFRERVRAAGTLERLEDGRGTPSPGIVAGAGTALFKNQAACPFRAFAQHRLGARALEALQPGLAASERGTLLHEMLRATWARIGSSVRLAELSAEALDALLAEAAVEALDIMRRRRPEALSGRFARVEERRLVAMARQWLDMERDRAPFEVEALERKAPVTIGGITVNARLDREDRVAGGKVVIDYKTSRFVSVASWLGKRPDEPQLPLYALAGGPAVKAIAFAQVRAGSLQFCGVATEAGLMPRVTTIDRNRTPGAEAFADWGALVAHWRSEMESLAAEYLAGDARVLPKAGPKTCRLCEQRPLCRVAEKLPAGALEPAEGDE